MKNLSLISMMLMTSYVISAPLAEVTKTAYFDIEIDGKDVGRIELGLFGNVVPKTTKNFEELCKGGHYMKKRASPAKSHNAVSQFFVTLS